MKHGCWYQVLQPDGTLKPCGKPVKYHIELDDDQNPVRVYDPACPEHMVHYQDDETEDV